MPITVDEFLEIIERLAPSALAEDWDNVGLQVGGRLDETGAGLVARNVSAEVLD
ncbi:MAG: Nif3-like dinuclear metal center hexameric protein [Actinomycetota bacterium]